MVRIGLIEEVMADARIKGSEGVSNMDIWRKSIPGRGKTQPNGRSVLLCFRMSMRAV